MPVMLFLVSDLDSDIGLFAFLDKCQVIDSETMLYIFMKADFSLLIICLRPCFLCPHGWRQKFRVYVCFQTPQTPGKTAMHLKRNQSINKTEADLWKSKRLATKIKRVIRCCTILISGYQITLAYILILLPFFYSRRNQSNGEFRSWNHGFRLLCRRYVAFQWITLVAYYLVTIATMFSSICATAACLKPGWTFMKNYQLSCIITLMLDLSVVGVIQIVRPWLKKAILDSLLKIAESGELGRLGNSFATLF
ncbi:hypothetical protein ACOME3_005343 [Neoechinorhynchus agilis]